jgi:hypothetical protein
MKKSSHPHEAFAGGHLRWEVLDQPNIRETYGKIN